VLDVHDTYLTRSTEEESLAAKAEGTALVRRTSDERTNFKLADALNFVTHYAKDMVYEEYDLDQPCTVIPSYVPWDWYSQYSLEWLGGLVYEGKVTISEELKKTSRVFKYCDYEEFAQEAHAKGLDFHLYGMRTDEPYEKVYDDIAFLHPPTNGLEIIRRITRHDWGLVGNVFSHPQWQKTSTNKMFEYIAAGVPVVAMNAQWSEEFVEEHGIGIAVHSIDELLENWSKHTEIRKNLILKRRSFSMEEHIGELIALYRELL
jgi:glycosyltransferase involved in cell wall biosynthesis